MAARDQRSEKERVKEFDGSLEGRLGFGYGVSVEGMESGDNNEGEMKCVWGFIFNDEWLRFFLKFHNPSVHNQ